GVWQRSCSPRIRSYLNRRQTNELCPAMNPAASISSTAAILEPEDSSYPEVAPESPQYHFRELAFDSGYQARSFTTSRLLQTLERVNKELLLVFSLFVVAGLV